MAAGFDPKVQRASSLKAHLGEPSYLKCKILIWFLSILSSSTSDWEKEHLLAK